MKGSERTLLTIILALLVAAAAALVLTRPSTSGPGRGTARSGTRAPQTQPAVDQGPLDTAEQLAALASTAQDQQFARTAAGLADSEVDLAFAGALRDAAAHPPSLLDPKLQKLAQHVQDLEAGMASDKNETGRLTAQLANATGARKDKLSMQLELAQAQAGVDADDLADAHQDLARAGGDPQAAIQQMLADHEASEQHTSSGGTGGSSPAPTTATAPQPAAPSGTTVSLARTWNQLRSWEGQLSQAQQDALAFAAKLTQGREQLNAAVSSEAPQQAALAQQARKVFAAGGKGGQEAATAALDSAQHLAQDRQTLAEFDQRVQAMQRLANVYGRWAGAVAGHRLATLHSLLWSLALVLLIALAAVAVEILLGHVLARIEPERQRLHTLRTIVRLVVRGAALLLILLVVLGPPSQLATVVALAGAGLTVALKDFIVGFLGWFVLLGRNGVRVGDWVEISGVAGEVIEVGLFRTVLLETGDWTDASHPTGRKVTFNNSFAIEGHYFNFSTSGRWIWDVLHVIIPFGTDPFSFAEEVRKLVAGETEGGAAEAEEDWQRVSDVRSQKFSAAPSVSVKPDPMGAMISVRYLARADGRNALNGRLYRQIAEMLQQRQIPQLAQAATPSPS